MTDDQSPAVDSIVDAAPAAPVVEEIPVTSASIPEKTFSDFFTWADAEASKFIFADLTKPSDTKKLV
jgi:hypothetical protein